MASNASLAGTSEYAATHVTERSARTLPGLRMLTLALAILTAGIVVLWLAGRESGDARTALIWLGVILLAAALLLLGGLTQRASHSAGRQHRLGVSVTAGVV